MVISSGTGVIGSGVIGDGVMFNVIVVTILETSWESDSFVNEMGVASDDEALVHSGPRVVVPVPRPEAVVFPGIQARSEAFQQENVCDCKGATVTVIGTVVIPITVTVAEKFPELALVFDSVVLVSDTVEDPEPSKEKEVLLVTVKFVEIALAAAELSEEVESSPGMNVVVSFNEAEIDGDEVNSGLTLNVEALAFQAVVVPSPVHEVLEDSVG